MKKTCPHHGEHETLIWVGPPSYADWHVNKIPWSPERPSNSSDKGCPFDCGLCSEHRQQTCTALIEVTQKCNLHCGFCFADSGNGKGTDPTIDQIRRLYESIADSGPQSNIQLSGGEPTVRDDLPEITAIGRSIGFDFIQVNTNGIRLANDPAYVESLKSSGLASVFLQFDGTEDSIYQNLRSKPLLETKVRAIEHCGQNDIGVVLVPTIVPGINDQNIGSIIRFAIAMSPIVRGVHFQPVSYFGRFPNTLARMRRITIPEIIRTLDVQTDGLVTINDFSPPTCENPKCSFKGSFVLMPDNTLKSFTNKQSSCCTSGPIKAEQGADLARRFVSAKWSAQKHCCSSGVDDGMSLGQWDTILERARTHSLSITGMAFQDAWNVDLQRLKGCCIHVAADLGRLIPFCAYNITASNGGALYRGRTNS